MLERLPQRALGHLRVTTQHPVSDDLTDARNQLEQADPNDATAVGHFAIAAATVVGAVGNTAQALNALDGNPQLDPAFEQAQSCQQLRSIPTPGRPGTR